MTTWLRCSVTPGMFSTERAVSSQIFNGCGFSLFAPEDACSGNLLRVTEIERRGDLVLVSLPAETLPDGHKAVTVLADQLVRK